MKRGNTRRQDTDAFDAAIDRAVRELMDVEPRADLRGRIIARIERPRVLAGRVFRPGVRWTWVLAPVAAAALVVIAVVLMRPATPTEVPRTGTDIVLRAPETPAEAPPVARREEPRAPSPARLAVPPARQAHAAAAIADDTIFRSARPDEGFAVVDALPAPPPIVVNTIAAPASTQPADLDIAPLRVAPLEVNALPDTPQERQE